MYRLPYYYLYQKDAFYIGDAERLARFIFGHSKHLVFENILFCKYVNL